MCQQAAVCRAGDDVQPKKYFIVRNILLMAYLAALFVTLDILSGCTFLFTLFGHWRFKTPRSAHVAECHVEATVACGIAFLSLKSDTKSHYDTDPTINLVFHPKLWTDQFFDAVFPDAHRFSVGIRLKHFVLWPIRYHPSNSNLAFKLAIRAGWWYYIRHECDHYLYTSTKFPCSLTLNF